MGNILLFTSVATNLLIYGLVAWWYIVPWTRRVGFAQAMTALALWHGLRTVGSTFWVPTVTDPDLPRAFADPAVIGDLVATGLGIAVALMFKYGRSGAVGLAWLFNVLGFADLILAFFNGISHDLTSYQLGPAWYIPTFIVPTMLITHGLMFWLLWTRSGEYQMNLRRPGASVQIPSQEAA